MLSSAGGPSPALHAERKSSDDRPPCLENPRPAGAESTLTENAASPFQAEPRQNQDGDEQGCRKSRSWFLARNRTTATRYAETLSSCMTTDLAVFNVVMNPYSYMLRPNLREIAHRMITGSPILVLVKAGSWKIPIMIVFLRLLYPVGDAMTLGQRLCASCSLLSSRWEYRSS